jgi:hypothetical protein
MYREAAIHAIAPYSTPDVAQDGDKPWLDFRVSRRIEMPQRPRIVFLHRVFIGGVAQQVTGQRVDRIEMRQRGISKTARALQILSRYRGLMDGDGFHW